MTDLRLKHFAADINYFRICNSRKSKKTVSQREYMMQAVLEILHSLISQSY